MRGGSGRSLLDAFPNGTERDSVSSRGGQYHNTHSGQVASQATQSRDRHTSAHPGAEAAMATTTRHACAQMRGIKLAKGLGDGDQVRGRIYVILLLWCSAVGRKVVSEDQESDV